MSIATEIRLRIKTEGESVLQGLGDKLNKIAANATVSSGKFSLLAGELRSVEQNTVRSTNALKTYSASWRELAGSVDLASKEFKEATAEAARLDAQIAKAEGRNRKAGSRLKTGAQVAGTAVAAGIFGGPEAAIGAAIGGIKGGIAGAQIGASIGAVVSQTRKALGATAEYAASLEKQRIALAGLTRNYKEYESAIAQVESLSKQFAIPQEIITRQFTKLAASVIGAGGTLEDTEKTFKGVAAGIRGTGGSLQDLESALLATSQVFSKGKVSAEELRQQIGERLPGAFTLFAQSLNMTPAQLDKALEDGKVSLQDFEKFAELLFARFGKSAEAIVNSPAAAGDRLQTSLSKLSENIGKLLAPIGAAFQNTFAAIVIAINEAASALVKFFNLNIADRVEEYAANVKTLQALYDKADGQAKNRLRTQLSTAELNLKLAQEQRNLRMTGAQSNRKDTGLPGIDPGTGSGAKAPKAPSRSLSDALSDLGSRKLEVNLTAQAAQLQIDITDAMKEGRTYMVDILNSASTFQVIDIKIKALEEERLLILKNQARFIKEGVKPAQIKEKLTANEEAKAKLLNERLAEEQKLNQANLQIEEARMKLGLAAREQIKDAQIAAGLVSPEEVERIRINRVLEGFREEFKDLIDVEALSEQLRKALEQASIDAKDFGKQFGKSFQDGIKSMGDLAGNLGSSFASAFEGMADQLTEFVTTGKANFRDFAASVLRDISRMIIRYAIFNAVKGIMNIFNPAAALGSSAANVAQYAPLAKGGVFAQNGIQAFARGGIVNKPTVFPFANGIGLMGEAGPEAIMPLRRGRDGNLGVMSSGGGTTNVVVNVDASGSKVEGDQSQAKALGNVISAAVQSELVRQKRPGGLLA
jgi:tape measure domain-containing protein